MSLDLNFLMLSCFALVSFFSMTFAGFGGMIIVLTFGLHFYPIHWLLPVLLPLTLLGNLYILIRHHGQIDYHVLFKQIVPLMGIGMIIGFAAFNFLQAELLRLLFGIIVISVSVRELVKLFRNPDKQKTLPKWISSSYIFGAGIVHGVFASGGPLLVYAANKMQLNKSVFRSTLSTVWLIMNMFLFISYWLTNKITWQTVNASGYLIPALIIGIGIGEPAHQRIPEWHFKIIVFFLLILSGFLILVK